MSHAETCWWSFQLHFIRSNPRDLNLGCWEEFLESKHIDVVWEPILNQMTCVEWADAPFCWKTYGFPDATISIHGFTTSAQRLLWVMLSKSAFEPFQWLRCVLSSDSFSLAYSLDCSKAYILSQCHKRLSIPRSKLFLLLSAQREGLWWSRHFDSSHLVSISRPFWEYDTIRSIRFSRISTTTSGRNTIAENLF